MELKVDQYYDKIKSLSILLSELAKSLIPEKTNGKF